MQLNWGDEETPRLHDYRETDEFKAYREKVIDVLKAAKRPMNIREIHAGLGTDANDRWTANALETAEFVMILPLLPCTLYSYEPDLKVITDLTAAEVNETFFVSNKRERFKARMTEARKRFNKTRQTKKGVTV